MLTKENIISAINKLDEPIILDEVLERIFLLEKIDIGIEQSKNGKIISDEEVEERIKTVLLK